MSFASNLTDSLKNTADPFKDTMSVFMPVIGAADAAIRAATAEKARLQCSVVDRQADKTILSLVLEIGGVQSKVPSRDANGELIRDEAGELVMIVLPGEEHRYDGSHHTLLATFAVCESPPFVRIAATPEGSDPFGAWAEINDATAATAILDAMAADRNGLLVTTLAKLLRS